VSHHWLPFPSVYRVWFPAASYPNEVVMPLVADTGCTSWVTIPVGSSVNVVLLPSASVDDTWSPSPSNVADVVARVFPDASRFVVEVTLPAPSYPVAVAVPSGSVTLACSPSELYAYEVVFPAPLVTAVFSPAGS
jgi:hypothetical protein